ncbi:MAG: dTDP-4-dehydrorhamnose 3,5-epimerase [Lishizhenia sp.]
MKVIKGEIEGLLIIEPSVFEDERGYFFESFNVNNFKKTTGLEVNFVQDNESKSQQGVLRGLHFQKPPFAQGKLVRVIKGSVLDVAVDLRKNSATYGKFQSIVLSEANKKQFYIPPGFAHGFLTLENETIFSYKCTNNYEPASEGCLLWNDENLNINWNYTNPQLSEKDKLGEDFINFVSQF